MNNKTDLKILEVTEDDRDYLIMIDCKDYKEITIRIPKSGYGLDLSDYTYYCLNLVTSDHYY